MWDLSSLARDQTHAIGIVSAESQPLVHQGSLRSLYLKFQIYCHHTTYKILLAF